ncbi:MAG: response regulator [Proteobacteria bacterium]|nr:MAG: response regulator [Pseudomonadota bacterium]
MEPYLRSSRRLRVLLVEEDLPQAAPLVSALASSPRLGAEITQFSRLADALSHLATAGADLALLSLKLPDSVGLASITCVRGMAPRLPIVVLARPEEEPLAIVAAQNGAQDYLVKGGPVDASLLASWLKHVVERHHILSILQESPAFHQGPPPAPRPPAPDPLPPARKGAVSTHTHGGQSPAPSRPTDALRAGDALAGFTVERLLGSGGMGTVYLATQQSLDRKVALKLLSDPFMQDPMFVKRFEREASALANLNHPNIVVIYDRGIHAGRCYFVMEYVDGMSLREVLQQKTLTPERTLKIVPYLCEALDYAHAQGVVHRDIKPENLLFTRAGQIKISDFGLARLTHPSGASSITYTGVIMGTKDYMAPEARTPNKRSDHRADIYSLGVVLYEMLTGEVPVGRFPNPSTRAAVDPRLDAIVMKALDTDPDARYPRAVEMGHDILKVVRSDGGASGRAMRAPPAQGGRNPFHVDFPSASTFKAVRFYD